MVKTGIRTRSLMPERLALTLTLICLALLLTSYLEELKIAGLTIFQFYPEANSVLRWLGHLTFLLAVACFILLARKPKVPYDTGWWKEKRGASLSRDEIVEGFDAIIGAKIADTVYFDVELINGRCFAARLLEISSDRPSGFVYSFMTRDGGGRLVHEAQVSRIIILSVDEA